MLVTEYLNSLPTEDQNLLVEHLKDVLSQHVKKKEENAELRSQLKDICNQMEAIDKRYPDLFQVGYDREPEQKFKMLLSRASQLEERLGL